jgi:probable F420-dependent oxidoreductase
MVVGCGAAGLRRPAADDDAVGCLAVSDAVGLKLAIVTPVLTMLPGAHARWEETASIDDVARIAVEAERLGYHHVTCSEHIGVPAAEAERRGATYWDPLATLGYIAARTVRIRLATNVLVLGYHHPLEIAKRYGTLDVVSGGRLILGVGVGSLREEFDLLDASFDDRGARADDAMRALRAALSVPEPEYHGEYYDFAGLVIDPHAVQERVPMWVGGWTLRSLRRAATLGDGWCPFAVSLSKVSEWLDQVERPASFEVVLMPPKPLDPIGDADAASASLAAMAAAGATIAKATVVHHSLDHYLEQLEALGSLIAV